MLARPESRSMADVTQDQSRPDTGSRTPIFVVVGLLVAGLALLTVFGAGARDRLLDRSGIGLRALAPWLEQAGLPSRSSHPRLHPRAEDMGLRILPLYDLNLYADATPPETTVERLDQTTLRDIYEENYFTKIKEIPTVVLLPKWRGAMVELGIAHERSLIPTDQIDPLLDQIALGGVGLTRGAAEFSTHTQDGQTLALFHAQLFDRVTLPRSCRVIVPFGKDALVIACKQTDARFPVYYVADPDLMNNHGLTVAGNAGFVPDLLTPLRRATDAPVYVDTSPDLLTTIERDDERQEYERGGEEFARFFDYPFTVFWAALLIVLASLFWRGTIRFGPVRTGDRFAAERSKRAVITAKARQLRLSGSDGHMVADFVRSEMRELAARSFGSDAPQNAEQRFLTLLARRDPELARAFDDLSTDLMQNAPHMSDAQLHRQLANYHSLLKKVVNQHEPV